MPALLCEGQASLDCKKAPHSSFGVFPFELSNYRRKDQVRSQDDASSFFQSQRPPRDQKERDS